MTEDHYIPPEAEVTVSEVVSFKRWSLALMVLNIFLILLMTFMLLSFYEGFSGVYDKSEHKVPFFTSLISHNFHYYCLAGWSFVIIVKEFIIPNQKKRMLVNIIFLYLNTFLFGVTFMSLMLPILVLIKSLG